LADFSLKIFKAVWAGVCLISKITQSVGLEAVEQPIYSINNVFFGSSYCRFQKYPRMATTFWVMI